MIPILDILAPIVSKVLDFIPDPQKKAEAQLKLQQELDANSQAILTALTAVDQKQAETNTEEAKSSNLFVAGWRPFIGWVCGIGIAWAFVIKPFADWILSVYKPEVHTPELAIGELVALLTSMLGFGGLRSWEKSQDIQNKH